MQLRVRVRRMKKPRQQMSAEKHFELILYAKYESS